jgi:hypothetical protein
MIISKWLTNNKEPKKVARAKKKEKNIRLGIILNVKNTILEILAVKTKEIAKRV